MLKMSGVNVKKYKLALFVVLSLLIPGSGCGPNVAGNYVGTETMAMTGMAAQSGTASILVSNPSGSSVSGTISGTGLTGNFTGSAVQSGLISNVTLTTVGSSNSGYSGGYPTTGYPNTGYPTTGYPNTGYPTTGYPTTGYPNTGYPTTGYGVSGYPSYCGTQTFIGNLTVVNNQISGNLTSMASSAVGGYVNTGCSGTVTINGTKSN
jgi:hypothetical protein